MAVFGQLDGIDGVGNPGAAFEKLAEPDTVGNSGSRRQRRPPQIAVDQEDILAGERGDDGQAGGDGRLALVGLRARHQNRLPGSERQAQSYPAQESGVSIPQLWIVQNDARERAQALPVIHAWRYQFVGSKYYRASF